MSFKVEVTDDPTTGKWFASPTRFLTRIEAEAYVAMVEKRWKKTRVTEVGDPIRYGEPATEDYEGGGD